MKKKKEPHRVEDNLDMTGERTLGNWIRHFDLKSWIIILTVFGSSGTFVVTAVYHYASELFLEDNHLVTEKVLEKALAPVREDIKKGREDSEETHRIVKQIRQVVTENQAVIGKPSDSKAHN